MKNTTFCKALLCLTLLCSACFAQEFRTFTTLPQEAKTSISFLTFVSAQTQTQQEISFRTFQATQVEQAVAKPIRKPKATLTTAAFNCPPCEVWKSRLDDLPFDVEVVKSRTSPITNRRGQYLFPVFSYRQDNGTLHHYQGSVDGFLSRHKKAVARN